jgi:hypothetical protein
MTATMLDCGHEPTRGASPGTGSATDAQGATMCYGCAEAREIEAFAKAGSMFTHGGMPPRFTGYVSGDNHHFTTWTGATLGRVTSYRVGRWQFTPSGGAYRLRYVTVTAPDNSVWSGQGSNDHDVITLRRRA